MSRKRKYPKTSDYYVYAHITPTGDFYIGTSGMQPYQRWNPSLYKTTSLYQYIQKYGWSNIRHFIFKDGLTREQAYQLEDLLIQEATDKGYCINSVRSGLVSVTDVNAYHRQYHTEHREKINTYEKQWYSEHREEINAKKKQYYTEHKEEWKVYQKQYYAEHQEERKAYNKQRYSAPDVRIYHRVTAYNQTHVPIETPLEAKQKYLSTGYIPNYIKNDDLQ